MIRRFCPQLGLLAAVLTCACSDPGGPLYFPDPTDITPVAFTPSNGSGNNTGDVIMTAEFNNDVDGARLSEAIISVVDENNQTIALLTPTYVVRLLVIQADGQLQQGLTHTVSVDGIFDTLGRPLAPFSWSFTVTADVTGPSVVNQIPTAGVTLPINSRIVVQFDEPLDEFALDPTWLVVQDGGVNVPGTRLYDPLAMAIVYFPATAFNPSSTIDVTIGANIVDRFGNAIQNAPPTISFNTDASIDTKAPTFDSAPVAFPTAVSQGATGIHLEWPVGIDDSLTGALADYMRYDVRATGPLLPAVGLPVATTYGVTQADVSGLPLGTYTFFVEVVDLAGNRRDFPCQTAPIMEACPPIAASSEGAITFTSDIQPMLVETCALQNCHGSSEAPGGVDFSENASYEDLLSYVNVDTGRPLIVPGDPNTSYLYWKISTELRAINDPPQNPFPFEGSFMPPEQLEPLPFDAVRQIQLWIGQGAIQ